MKINKLTIILLMWSGCSFAMQNITVNEALPVRAVVSQNDINLISLQNDRIESLVLPNSVEVEQNNKNGSAYLKFKSSSVVKGFLTTERGAKYQLEFVPTNIGSETIVLITPGPATASAVEAKEYTQMLAQLLRAMYNGSELDGYVHTLLNKSIKFKKMQLVLDATYVGTAIDGQIFEYENTTDKVVRLKEIDFNGTGVRAVSIVNKTLYSGDVTKIYIMRDRI